MPACGVNWQNTEIGIRYNTDTVRTLTGDQFSGGMPKSAGKGQAGTVELIV